MLNSFTVTSCLQRLCTLALLTLLAACASGPKAPEPAALGPSPNLLAVQPAWKAQLGKIDFPLRISTAANAATLASTDGVVTSLHAQTGAVLWQIKLGTTLAAGVGSDGYYSAVVSTDNQLITMQSSGELWRAQLPGQVFTPPLVAGKRVFVLVADGSVLAFDAGSGARLWFRPASDVALVLRHPGLLLALRNTLVVGIEGSVLGLDPLTGETRWEVPVALPRATNEIERLVTLVDGVNRQGDTLCVRAFQAAVGCLDANQGRLLWAQPADGAAGLTGSEQLLYGADAEGKLLAWNMRDGSLAWSSDLLRYRQLGGPLLLGRSLVVGDSNGLLHLLAAADGSLLTRLSTDGSAIAAPPVMLGQTLLVATVNGAVQAFQPQ